MRRFLSPWGDLLDWALDDRLFHNDKHMYIGEAFITFLWGLGRRKWLLLRREEVAGGLFVFQSDKPDCKWWGRLPPCRKRKANTACSMRRRVSRVWRPARASRMLCGVSDDNLMLVISLAARRCTFSRRSLAVEERPHHTRKAYSKLGRIAVSSLERKRVLVQQQLAGWRDVH